MTTWFYKSGDKPIDPIDEATMRAWIKQGSIAPSQLVRADGSVDWRQADRCFSDLMSTTKVPDLLGKIAGTYFECDGLCFMPVFEVFAGKCRVNLFYQDRFTQDCHAEVLLTPRGRGLCNSHACMTRLTIEVICSGGEFGVVRRLYAVPKNLQGEKMVFEINGEASYLNGKGDMIRFRSGLSVSEREHAAMGLSRLLLVFGGIVVTRKPARLTCILPKGVAEVVPEALAAAREILWAFPGEQNADLAEMA